MSSSLDAGSSSLVGKALDTVLPRVKAAAPRPHTSHHSRPSGGGVDIEEDEHNDELFPTESNISMNITDGALEEASRITTAENGSLIIQANKGYQLNIASSTGKSVCFFPHNALFSFIELKLYYLSLPPYNAAPIRETSALKVVRQAQQGRPEAEELRPIYRKGFPAAKKSIRAEV